MQTALRLFSLSLFLLVFQISSLSSQNYFSLAGSCIDTTTVAVAFTGETEITTCAADGESDRIRFATSNLFMAYGYVVVDENDIIVSIGFSNFIDFEMLPAGQLRVYAFSNYGLITAQVGDDFNTTPLAVPCFGLTTNFVTVNNASPGSTVIGSPSGETEFSTCPNDGIPDIISFTFSGGLPNVTYVITDEDNVVLALTEESSFDFDPAGPGICRVYAATYSGTLAIEVGDDLDLVEVSDGCGGISENYLTVSRLGVDGGTVSTVDGSTIVSVCPGDGIADIVAFASEGASGNNFTYVVTDENNVILALPEGNEVDFDGAGVGICRLWGLAYEGDIIASAGDVASEVDLASGCFALSENFVIVVREVPVGGTVSTVDGATEASTCPGDGNPDLIAFANTGSSNGTFTYVVTDENNIILGLPGGNEVDFEDAGTGVCRVWGLTYQGELLAALGDDAGATQLASSCFVLSDNFVTVIRSVPAGGTVATLDGETEIRTCPGDGIDDIYSFASNDATGTNFTFLVTDDNNIVIGEFADGIVNFEGAGEGVCRVWGLAYDGDLTVEAGDDAANTQLASECFALSDNFVTVIRTPASGGTVELVDGSTEITTCPGDGVPDILTFVSNGASGPSFSYVITDENNMVLGIPGGNTVDFEDVAPGTCRVWGLSYDGDLLIGVGDIAGEVDLATGCAALSDNFVTVIRLETDGGTVSTEAGETMIMTCPGDGIPDVFFMDSTGTNLTNYNYVITDENNVILQLVIGDRINLENAGVGVCRVWGFGYDGVIIAQPGDTVGVSQLASDCVALSDNFVTAVREVPAGGTVSTEAGETDIFICPGDALPDVVRFDSTGTGGGTFTYLVTDENNVILAIPEGDEVDFEAAGLGICRLWGLVYQGELLAMPGTNAAEAQLAFGCFALSDNFVTVNRQDVVGGLVTTANGETEITTCPGDGIDDIIAFMSNGATGPNFTYVVTDDNNVILGLPDGDSQNFEGAGEGVCRVWGLAYAGDLLAMMGDNADQIDLASGCFALSDNFVTVIRTVPEGGEITVLGDDDDITVCSGDAVPDVISFSNNGASSGNYVYVVTQENIIISALPGDSFDFNNAISGTFQVYGLSYAGSLNVIPGDDIFGAQLATSCFDLSENAITITVTQVDACEITAVGTVGDIVYLCPQNPDDGLVEFTSCSTLSDTNYQYVITTNMDIIVFQMEGNSFDFGGLPLPEARVYAISYSGSLATPLIGQNIRTGELSDECFAITDNFITIINAQPEAGVISLADGTDQPFCGTNGDATVTVETTSTSAAGYVILVTDENNNILSIQTLPDVDVADLAPGNYRFYGLSYTGNVTAMVGDNIELVALADNCFEITTDFIPFERAGDLNGGIISMIGMDTDTAYVCPMDGEPDVLVLESTITDGPYNYLITDEDGIILNAVLPGSIFNLDPAEEGICRVYGYAFTGNVTPVANIPLEEANLSDSCFALSENFITVIRQTPNGGTVTTTDDTTEVTIVLGSDNTSVEVTTAGFADLINFTYLITDENNIVLGMGDGPSFDFGDAPVGVCRIWGLSYQGDLTVNLGDDAANTDLATSCFALSENFVTVNRVEEGFQPTAPNPDATQLTMRPYPNPAGGSELQVVIQSNLPLPEGRAFVRDLNGRSWATQDVAGGQRTAVVNFDISQLPNGLFVVQYRAGDRQEVVRFIRQ